MTTLDVLLILIGVVVIGLSATQGLLRVLMMFLIFYVLCVAAGMATLAADIVQGLGTAVTGMLEAAPPSLEMAQVFVFLGLLIPLFVGAYFLTKVAFADTTLPKLGGFDNVLGAVVGIVLALLIMAVLFNTVGVAVNAPRRATPGWTSVRTAFYYSMLRPYMMDVIRMYRPMLFMFMFIDYPIFFTPQG